MNKFFEKMKQNEEGQTKTQEQDQTGRKTRDKNNEKGRKEENMTNVVRKDKRAKDERMKRTKINEK